ncbi:WD40 repeat-like protein [Massarina eburnea CBS 473.64]|uniref:WD40 repeat-like protein n=1 Tax=Massarina eburnea CBS 473.64 TaxID=1395130 RepID=A0A6A6S2V0_9PLEO|nr:WD40 repeat-like protein [Massarina eburnea CBS 473.64]
MADDGYFPHDGARDQQPDSDTDMAASASSTVRPSLFSAPTAARKRGQTLRPIIVEDRGMAHDLSTAPASPPTPAPSPTPTQRALDWSTAAEHEDSHIKDIRALFGDMNGPERLRLLGELLNQCGSHELSFVAEFVSPRLKKDPFVELPTELCLRILECVDDPTTLVRASLVSKRWHNMVNDDGAWRALCRKFSYRGLPKPERMDDDDPGEEWEEGPKPQWLHPGRASRIGDTPMRELTDGTASSASSEALRTQSLDRAAKRQLPQRKPKATTYRSHFKARYMVETAWRQGGHCDSRQITPDQGVVTSLHLTKKYIVVALDNAKIHVFDTLGNHQRTLQGHVMGVWAMVPWGDLLVSGGCDRDVRVWNLENGSSVHTLRGHTSTVRCLKMSDSKTAISGSRDTTLRVWDLERGACKHVLVGHQASVRCLEIHGDICVSGSYDTTAKIWSISSGKCLRTLTGHFSQIYAIAFDGKKIATGSLDTSVRIWDPNDG